MVPKNEATEEPLEDQDICKEKDGVKEEGETFLEAKNGDALLISDEMAEEERQIEEENVGPALNETQFTKLDELLTKAQLYSEFLLEKINDITNKTLTEDADEVNEETKECGKKRKAKSVNTRRAKTAVSAMLQRSEENNPATDSNLSNEERAEKEQRELVPLLTGGKLKPYQIKGVKWLISLWQNGLNGILADQMGLGKTIQTIGFLAHLKGKGLDGPYLVIAPLSTLSNWLNEINRFVPTVNTVIYHGDRKARDEIRRKHMPKNAGPKFPIVVTSYEVAMNDAYLRHYDWKYLVVDEGHRLKNSKCKLLRELKWLHIENKLLLTGTPLQNNLAELWSLLNFILPDIFSSHEEFESWFDFSGKTTTKEEGRKVKVVAKLHAILRPFLLRRMKEDVEHSLSRKKEIISYANLTEHQRNFQEHLINKMLETYLLEKVDTGRGMKGKLQNMMIQLRKNCNHPDLLEAVFEGSCFYPPVEQIVGQCGKFQLLERLLQKAESAPPVSVVNILMALSQDQQELSQSIQGLCQEKAAPADSPPPCQRRRVAPEEPPVSVDDKLEALSQGQLELRQGIHEIRQCIHELRQDQQEQRSLIEWLVQCQQKQADASRMLPQLPVSLRGPPPHQPPTNQ